MRYKVHVFAYSILLTTLVLMIPITSYQEEFETVENTESVPIKKTIRIMGTEENSISPNQIYVRTFDIVTFVNLDGSNGGTDHTFILVKIENTEPDSFFYSDLIKTGKSFKITIIKPGIYQYYDPIFPNIRGTIHVV